MTGARSLVASLVLAAACGQGAFDDREARAWSRSAGAPAEISSSAFAVAITTVDREQPGATVVIAGSGPSSLTTFSFDVGGELEAHGVDTAPFPAVPVMTGALDPVAGGKGVIATADGEGGILFHDARTGDVGPEFRAAIGEEACGIPLGAALVFALTDPEGDVEPDLIALSDGEIAILGDLDLASVADDPRCTRCALPAAGAAVATGTVDDDDGEDAVVLAAAGDQIAAFSAAGIAAQDGQECGEPLLLVSPPAGERFAAPLAVGDLEDNEWPEVAVASPDHRVVYVLHDVQAGSAPELLRIPAPADSVSFGASMAFGDFDGDEIEELAIGDPDARPEAVPAAGQVTLYSWDGEELKPSDTLYDSEPEEGQRFGASLVVAEFGTGGAEYRDLLVVGADGEVFTYFKVTAGAVDPRTH